VIPAVAGAAVGLIGGTGAVAALAYSPLFRRVTLEDRLGPYLRDDLPQSRLLTEQISSRIPGFLGISAGGALRRAAAFVDRAAGGSSSLQRRLEQAGSPASVEEFRAEQVVCGAAGFVAGLLVAVLGAVRGAAPPLLLLVCCLSSLGGVVAREKWLTHRVHVREARILAEFPTVAELLALTVSAGAGPLAALERVSRTSSGELGAEFRRLLAEVRAGSPLTAALRRMSGRMSLPVVARFVDGLVVAVERGTPLAEVLRSQAADARESGKRALLDSAGRKEIFMLVPVVFLILPVVVVFALFPGFYSLSLNVP
jgi:tight adherence protein C